MSKLDDLIEKLPDEYKEIAKQYLPILARFAFDDAKAWVKLVLDNEWRAAYDIAAEKMTTTELVAGQETLNREFTELNHKNASFVQVQKGFVGRLFEVFVLLLRAQLGDLV